MKKFSVPLVALFVCFATSFAQLTIDGKRLAYDRLTNSYLLTVDRSGLSRRTLYDKIIKELTFLEGDDLYARVVQVVL